MSDRTILIPGPDHPIEIAADPTHVRFEAGGVAIADSRATLALKEATYPVVRYVPPADVDFSRLERSAHTSYCPYKGECSYYSIVGAGERGVNAVWVYEAPYAPVAVIKDHLAFYVDRVDVIEAA